MSGRLREGLFIQDYEEGCILTVIFALESHHVPLVSARRESILLLDGPEGAGIVYGKTVSGKN
jgi:hypothetical protein